MLIAEDARLLAIGLKGPTLALPAAGARSNRLAAITGVVPVVDYRGMPVLYLPPGIASAKRPAPPVQTEHASLPVIKSVSVLDSARLKDGIPCEIERESDEGTSIPPWVERAAKLVSAFLGHFANDDLVHRQLRRAVDLYDLPVRDLDVHWASHLMAWDAWEVHPERWTRELKGEIPWRRLYDFDMPFAGLKAYALPHDYREAILHLCARERMGKMWPRLVHSLVLSYILTANDAEGPSFEPTLFPRLLDPQENAIDGHHKIYSVQMQTPAGKITIAFPDESKRDVMRRLGDTPQRKLVETHWAAIESAFDQKKGYSRRRDVSADAIEHVTNLFRRHVLRESTKEIAADVGLDRTTVDTAIRDLRALLDLQPQNAVLCPDHKRRPDRLHESK